MTTYEGRCALSGIGVAELLCASHIKPWSASVERRADPRNGILLNALFDRAFDRGLISFDVEMRVIVSPRLDDSLDGAELACSLDQLEGRTLNTPTDSRRIPISLRFIERMCSSDSRVE